MSSNGSLHLADLLQRPPGKSSLPPCQSLTPAKLLKQPPAVGGREEVEGDVSVRASTPPLKPIRFHNSTCEMSLGGTENMTKYLVQVIQIHDWTSSNLSHNKSYPLPLVGPSNCFQVASFDCHVFYNTNAFVTLFQTVGLLRGNLRPKHGVCSVVRNGGKLSLNVQFIGENWVWWFSQREAPQSRFSLLTSLTTKS